MAWVTLPGCEQKHRKHRRFIDQRLGTPLINPLSSIFVRITTSVEDWKGQTQLPGHLQSSSVTGERERVERCISMSEQLSKGARHMGLSSQEKLREGVRMGPKRWAAKAICSTRVTAKKSPVW